MPTFTEIEGLGDAEMYFKALPGVSRKAATIAINQTMDRGGLKLIRQRMNEQIAFPQGYLGEDRLGVTQYARESDMTGIITGRQRATSLARFAAPGTPVGNFNGGGVRVAVKRGSSTTLRNAWLVRLRRGEQKSPDSFNLGLAVRVKPGEQITGKYSAHSAWLVPDAVALLYGPSVDQVFRDTAEDESAAILTMVGTEFLRQFERLA